MSCSLLSSFLLIDVDGVALYFCTDVIWCRCFDSFIFGLVVCSVSSSDTDSLALLMFHRRESSGGRKDEGVGEKGAREEKGTGEVGAAEGQEGERKAHPGRSWRQYLVGSSLVFSFVEIHLLTFANEVEPKRSREVASCGCPHPRRS